MDIAILSMGITLSLSPVVIISFLVFFLLIGVGAGWLNVDLIVQVVRSVFFPVLMLLMKWWPTIMDWVQTIKDWLL